MRKPDWCINTNPVCLQSEKLPCGSFFVCYNSYVVFLLFISLMSHKIILALIGIL